DGVRGQHHDAGEQAVVKRRDDELRRREPGHDRCVDRQDRTRSLAGHAEAPPNSPPGLNTRTNATRRVETIRARAGEKNIETSPSLSPRRNAAASVPRRLPSPPTMTTVKDASSASRPIR